jgi:hypothetical protein
MKQARVTIAISTMGRWLETLVFPAPHPDIAYLIIVQNAASPEPADLRSDLRVVHDLDIGLSHSRNLALHHAKTQYLLFADDDHQLLIQGILTLTDALDAAPSLAFAAGYRSKSNEITHRPLEYDLSVWNSGRLCAPEFMIRLSAIREMAVRFDPGFGLGAKYPVGEDYIFVADILGAGGTGRAFPVCTGSHPGPSTGDNWNDLGLLAARAAVLKRVFGHWTWIVRPAYAWRHRHRMASWAHVLKFAANWF